MFSDDISIRVKNLGKAYQIYNVPRDRLKQFLVPRLYRVISKTPKQYYREFWALKDVSFEVRKGETVGIIGCNGSGKSTLLQLISGILTPSTGSVDVNGRIAALLELGSGFNPQFTGRENIYLNGTILGLSREEIDTRFDEIVEFADIGDFIEQPVKTYSSGMMLRLAFSVSVNVQPDILIIDEALAVGDAAFQFKCMERLERLTQSGVTLLFVSHDLNSVRTFCKYAIYLDKGVLKVKGNAEEVGEMYLLDLHNLRKKAVGDGVSVVLKSAISSDEGIAFGTEKGNIMRAVFTDTNSDRSVYRKGERVAIKVDVIFDSSVKNPFICLIIQNRQLISISGRYFQVNKETDADGLCRASVIFSFVLALQEGHYFASIRLEDRFSDKQFLIIEKQAKALNFEVTHSGKKDFLGIMDMQIDCAYAK